MDKGVCGEGGWVTGFLINTELLTVSFGSGGVWRGLWAYCMKLANRGGWRRPRDAIYGRDSAREDNTRGRYCVLWHYHTHSKQIEKGVSGGSWFRGKKKKEEGITHGQCRERWELLKKGLWQEVVFVGKKMEGSVHLYCSEWRCNAQVKHSYLTYLLRYSNKSKSNLFTTAFINKAMVKIYSNVRRFKNICNLFG